MGDYYNATRGPLSATLTDGSALSLSPKKWIYIPAENEGSASILKLCEKGFLVRAKVPMTQLAIEAIVAPAPPEPAPKASEKEAASVYLFHEGRDLAEEEVRSDASTFGSTTLRSRALTGAERG
jgi:hypothetical protein